MGSSSAEVRRYCRRRQFGLTEPYFPLNALRQEFFRKSDTQTVCPWKGTARYYSIVVADKTNSDAAWYYSEPKTAASQIAGRVAFWKGVEVKSAP